MSLLIPTVTSFVLLLGSYVITGARRDDFGNVPHKWHTYMLVSALLATVALWFVIVRASVSTTSTKAYRDSLAVYSTSYFLLQLLFIPLVRKRTVFGREPVQLLLLVCTIPMALIFNSAWAYSNSTLDTSLTGFTFFHIFVNDALLYGHMF